MTGGIHTAMHDGHSNHTCVGLHCGTQTFVSQCFMITYTLGDICGIHKIPQNSELRTQNIYLLR